MDSAKRHSARPSIPLPGLGSTDEHASDRNFAINLSRGLDVLRAFTAEEPVLGNREICDRTGLARSTVSRLTYTLVLLGYLTPVEGLYRLAPGVLALSHPMLAGLEVRQMARPSMQELANATGCTVNLGVRDRLQSIYIDSCRADRRNTYLPDIGSLRPLLAGAIGRALLLASSVRDRNAVLNRIKLADPQRFALEHPHFLKDSEYFAKHGYCWSRGDWRKDVHAIATPLRQPKSAEPLALSCTIAVRELKTRDFLPRVVAPRLLAAAELISQAIQLPNANRR